MQSPLLAKSYRVLIISVSEARGVRYLMCGPLDVLVHVTVARQGADRFSEIQHSLHVQDDHGMLACLVCTLRTYLMSKFVY